MSDDQKWAQEDAGFCTYCKPWHWLQEQHPVHIRRGSPWFQHIDTIVIGGVKIPGVIEVWLPQPGIMYVIALEAGMRSCKCGSPEMSCRLLWTQENPNLTLHGWYERTTLTVASSRDGAPKTDTHGLYITNDTGTSLNVAVAGNIGPDAKITISEDIQDRNTGSAIVKVLPPPEPWMTPADYDRFVQAEERALRGSFR